MFLRIRKINFQKVTTTIAGAMTLWTPKLNYSIPCWTEGAHFNLFSLPMLRKTLNYFSISQLSFKCWLQEMQL